MQYGEKIESTALLGCNSVISQNVLLFTVSIARSSSLSLEEYVSDKV
jgi:hypothetical protein